MSKFKRFFSLFFTNNPNDDTIDVFGLGPRHYNGDEARRYVDRMERNKGKGENHECWDKLYDQVLKDRQVTTSHSSL